jgi:hypothetical protein
MNGDFQEFEVLPEEVPEIVPTRANTENVPHIEDEVDVVFYGSEEKQESKEVNPGYFINDIDEV